MPLTEVGITPAPLADAKGGGDTVERSWPAQLALAFARRGGCTRVVSARHKGPLRIQRPFYPEGACAHVYLLHPPGGLVVGDALSIQLSAAAQSRALVTTPSAGKVYSLAGLKHSDRRTTQTQDVCLNIESDGVLEWLPQETIVFDGANARLNTQVNAAAHARFCLWDIVCLGRPACKEQFLNGSVHQNVRVDIDGRPVMIERNRIDGADAMMTAPWGLQGAGSFGTLLASVAPERQLVDDLLDALHENFPAGRWGLTQKNEVFIARYLGANAAECRHGFTAIWKVLRPLLCGREAVEPRIWHT